MNNKVKVSAIIYVRNGLPYIGECLESVRGQTLRNIEIIVVDAGSTDGTCEYLSEQARCDCRIHIMYSEPSVGRQFNKALSVAQGEYIAVCEADDFVKNDAYEKLYSIAERERCDVIRADYNQFFGKGGSGEKFLTHSCTIRSLYNQKINLTDNFFVHEGINGFWSGLYRRSFLIDNDIKMNETAGAAYQDVGFSFLCQCLAKTVYFCDDAFYQYRLDNPNASLNVNNRVTKTIREFNHLEDELKIKKIWGDYYDEYFEWELTGLRRAYIKADSDIKGEVLAEICGEVKSQLERNNIPEEEFEWQNDIEGYIVMQDADIKRFLEFLECIDTESRRIIIFGEGFLGQIVGRVMDCYNKSYEVVDNSIELQGSEAFGCTVQPPRIVVEKYYNNAVYLIANVNHADEIRNQLVGLGINFENIIVSNNDELLLRRILIESRG